MDAAIEAVIPYSMDTPVDDTPKPPMPQMNDETVDQDDPLAPDSDVFPEINEDAAKDIDKDNTDSMFADSQE